MKTSKIRKEIEGTVFLMKSDNDDCACCDGVHVYCQGIKLDDFKSNSPKHFGKGVQVWLDSMFDYKQLEGKKIQITATVLE